MNRTIKFRAWETVVEKMTQPFTLNELAGEMPRNFENYIIMQFTGLLDKNSKEIYEGDIIKLDKGFADSIGADRENCLVGFHQGAFMYGRHSLAPQHMDTYLWMAVKNEFQDGYCEVIDNIFENSELLNNK